MNHLLHDISQAIHQRGYLTLQAHKTLLKAGYRPPWKAHHVNTKQITPKMWDGWAQYT